MISLVKVIQKGDTTMRGKRVGRPELKASERRTSICRFNVTKAEFLAIRGKAKDQGQTVSEYLRQCSIPKDEAKKGE
jgi:hypothetical protein